MTEYKDFKDLWDIDFKYDKTAPSLSYLINCVRRSQQKCPVCSADLRPYPSNVGFRSVGSRFTISCGLSFELFMTSPQVAREAQRTLS